MGSGPGGRWSGWGRSGWGWSGWGPKFRAVFFSSPTLFFFQFPKIFVTLRWSLRDFIIENVFTTYKFGVPSTSCEAPAARLKRPGFRFFFSERRGAEYRLPPSHEVRIGTYCETSHDDLGKFSVSRHKERELCTVGSYTRLSGEEAQCWYNTSRFGVDQISVKVTFEPHEGKVEQRVLRQFSQFSDWLRIAQLSLRIVHRHVSKSFFKTSCSVSLVFSCCL